MKTKEKLKAAVIMVAIVVLLMPVTGWGQSSLKSIKNLKGKKPYKPCGIRFDRMSRASGAPGDVFTMYGQWGATQGTKLPCINKGGMNKLIVLNWTPTAIKVKIPHGLAPGMYRVGCYCQNPAPSGTYGTTWKDFKVLEKRTVKDVDITDIYLDKKCRIWIKHSNRGTAPLDVVLRERVWVNGRLVDDSRETIRIAPGSSFAHGVGADPGIKVAGRAVVKAQIDVDNTLRESNERNNILTKTLKCHLKMPLKSIKKVNMKTHQLKKD